MWKQGRLLYESRPDNDRSLTNCISYVVMEREKITEALTADRHFEQAGFVALLKPWPSRTRISTLPNNEHTSMTAATPAIIAIANGTISLGDTLPSGGHALRSATTSVAEKPAATRTSGQRGPGGSRR